MIPKRKGLRLTAGIALLALTRALHAQPVTNNSGLGFGLIVASAGAGSVTVSPAGVRSAAGGVVLANGTGVSAAMFTAAGPSFGVYSVVLPNSTTLSAGANNMAVDTFTSNPSGGGNLDGGGSATVRVGATLHVAAGQQTGAYSGTFPLTLAF
jgi:hypothetical protein